MALAEPPQFCRQGEMEAWGGRRLDVYGEVNKPLYGDRNIQKHEVRRKDFAKASLAQWILQSQIKAVNEPAESTTPPPSPSPPPCLFDQRANTCWSQILVVSTPAGLHPTQWENLGVTDWALIINTEIITKSGVTESRCTSYESFSSYCTCACDVEFFHQNSGLPEPKLS